MLGQILLTFVTVLVGVNLVPSVANSVDDVFHGTFTNTSNVTGAGAAILNLVPLFFVLGIVITTIQSSIAVLARLGF